MSEINSIGVVGAGFMGSGIAESAARAGLSVVVHEPTEGSGALARANRGSVSERSSARS